MVGESRNILFLCCVGHAVDIAALLVEPFTDKVAKAALAVSAVASLGLLAYCKYADFLSGNFNAVTGAFRPASQGGSAGRHQLFIHFRS